MLVTVLGDKAIVVVIDDDSYERLQKGDPFTLPFDSIKLDSVKGMELVIGRASTEAMSKIKEPLDLIKHIFRGFELKPEDGYKPIKVDFSKERLDEYQ